VTNHTGLRVPLKIVPPLPPPSSLSKEKGVEFGKMEAEFIISDLKNPEVTNDTGLSVPLKMSPPLPQPSPLYEGIGVEV